MSTHTPAKAATAGHAGGRRAAGLGDLGRTTSPRGWIGLIAVLLVIVGFGIWGLFGTIPVQSTIRGTVTNGSYPIQITAGVSGTVTDIITSSVSQATIPQGTVLMKITPADGGSDVDVKTPVSMGVSLDVIEGSPVQADSVVASGTQVSNGDDGKAQVYAFLSIDVITTLQSAQSLTVTPTAPSLAGDPAPIKVAYIGVVPTSETQIARLTGNTVYAQQAYQSAGGAPYAVLFAYENAADANQVKGNAAAEITVTESTPHPLSLLFGG